MKWQTHVKNWYPSGSDVKHFIFQVWTDLIFWILGISSRRGVATNNQGDRTNNDVERCG
jgi:hypothetical protein